VTLISALDAPMRDALRAQESADLVVGIPSFRNAATIGHVTQVAAEGLRVHFPDARAVIVNADGGSEDGTTDRVRASADGVPAIAGRYQGRSGKGSAFRAIFEAVSILNARACAVVDSDLRSITPEWIGRLLGPVVRGEAGYVTPLYARHKHDGTITNTIAYPLTRALYGARVRQPIGGEFGFAAELAQGWIAEPVIALGRTKCRGHLGQRLEDRRRARSREKRVRAGLLLSPKPRLDDALEIAVVESKEHGFAQRLRPSRDRRFHHAREGDTDDVRRELVGGGAVLLCSLEGSLLRVDKREVEPERILSEVEPRAELSRALPPLPVDGGDLVSQDGHQIFSMFTRNALNSGVLAPTSPTNGVSAFASQ